MDRSRGNGTVDSVVTEIVELRPPRLPFVALSRRQLLSGHAWRIWRWRSVQGNAARLQQLQALRAERFELMARLASCRGHGLLHADHDGSREGRGVPGRDAPRNIKGALVGRGGGHPEGLKDVFKGSIRPARRW
jgi:hypothetical protein